MRPLVEVIEGKIKLLEYRASSSSSMENPNRREASILQSVRQKIRGSAGEIYSVVLE